MLTSESTGRWCMVVKIQRETIKAMIVKRDKPGTYSWYGKRHVTAITSFAPLRNMV